MRLRGKALPSLWRLANNLTMRPSTAASFAELEKFWIHSAHFQ